MDKKIKIGISGKRDILDADVVKNTIYNEIFEILKREGISEFVGYSSIAKGADTIFAQVVSHEYKQQLKIILPFEEEEYALDFDSEPDLSAYRQLIKEMGITKTIYKGIKNQEDRNEAYLAAGQYIIENVDYMIFVWDGLKPNGVGGTADLLGYASKNEKVEIIIVNTSNQNTDKTLDEIKSTLYMSDSKAIALKKKRHNVWRGSIILAVFAVISFSSYTSFHPSQIFEMILVCFELCSFAVIFTLIRTAKKRQYHSLLLSERLRAEKLRLIECYYMAGVNIAVSEFTVENDKELTSIAATSNAEIEGAYHSSSFAYYMLRKLVLDQILYHKRRLKSIGKKPLFFNVAASIVYIAFILLLMLHFGTLVFDYYKISPLLHVHYNHHLSLFFSILLPPLYAAIQGWIHFNEWNELKDQSIHMVDFLEKQLEELRNAKITMEELKPILYNVNVSMLTDNNNWHIVINKNSTPHPLI